DDRTAGRRIAAGDRAGEHPRCGVRLPTARVGVAASPRPGAAEHCRRRHLPDHLPTAPQHGTSPHASSAIAPAAQGTSGERVRAVAEFVPVSPCGRARTVDAIDTRVSRLLGVRYPIVQAPMGWIARAQLASAVSNAGGLGIIETSSGELDAV